MTALVTGATGFIGSHLVNELKKKEKVIILVRDVMPSKWLEEALDGCVKVRGDINDYFCLLRVMNRYQVDKVFHLAALSIVKTAYRDPINCFQTNVMGTVNVLEAARQLNVERVLVQSTDKVYGNTEDATLCSELQPTEPYGTSKVCADYITRTYAQVYGMRAIVSRMCNVYGLDYSNRVVPNTIRSCLRGEPPIIYKDDSSKRQYIYIDDAVRALRFLMDMYPTFLEANIATNDILTQEDVVLRILQFFPTLKPKYVDKPEIRQVRSQSMRVVTWPPHWEPEVEFHEGVLLTIEAFRRYGL